jgi:hypothetical protein
VTQQAIFIGGLPQQAVIAQAVGSATANRPSPLYACSRPPSHQLLQCRLAAHLQARLPELLQLRYWRPQLHEPGVKLGFSGGLIPYAVAESSRGAAGSAALLASPLRQEHLLLKLPPAAWSPDIVPRLAVGSHCVVQRPGDLALRLWPNRACAQ